MTHAPTPIDHIARSAADRSPTRLPWRRAKAGTTCGISAVATAVLVASSLSSPATAQDDSLYGSVAGSLRAGAATGSGEGVSGSVDLAADDFYRSIPEFTDGTPGQILKSQPSSFALGVPLVDWASAEARRVAYVSTDKDGRPIPVTGTVLTPLAPWKGPGPRPVLTVAPGTQGSGDACAPGKLLPYGLEYEGIPIAVALARGWNVAITDLHGLGTNPPHTYMNRINQGHATLDMARAAANVGLPGISKDSPVATWGYSQGGGGSASALELHASYAPDVNLKAGYAGGVPADLAMTATAIDGGALAGTMGYTINGFLYSNLEVRPALEENLNQRGKDMLAQTATECIPQSLVRHGFANSRDLTVSGESLNTILQREPMRSVIAAQEIGHRPPKVPVYVGHGTNDDSIPVEQSRRMARMWCEGGTPVNYQEHPIPSVAPLVDHVHPMITHQFPAIDWLERVINGQDFALTQCQAIRGNEDPAPLGSSSGSSSSSAAGLNDQNSGSISAGSAETAVETSVSGSVYGATGSSVATPGGDRIALSGRR